MIVGLTGGIGSGKSTVARIFSILGCPVFNSDEAAQQVYFDAGVKARVIELLGEESYHNEQQINKPFISSKIFSDTGLLHQLNGVIHPAVKKLFKDFVNANKDAVIIKESALLFEAKLQQDMDKIIIVATDDELRIKRVMSRDSQNREDVLKRIKSQLPQEEKIKHSDFVIYNNEDRLIIPQVLAVYEKLRQDA